MRAGATDDELAGCGGAPWRPSWPGTASTIRFPAAGPAHVRDRRLTAGRPGPCGTARREASARSTRSSSRASRSARMSARTAPRWWSAASPCSARFIASRPRGRAGREVIVVGPDSGGAGTGQLRRYRRIRHRRPGPALHHGLAEVTAPWSRCCRDLPFLPPGHRGAAGALGDVRRAAGRPGCGAARWYGPAPLAGRCSDTAALRPDGTTPRVARWAGCRAGPAGRGPARPHAGAPPPWLSCDTPDELRPGPGLRDGRHHGEHARRLDDGGVPRPGPGPGHRRHHRPARHHPGGGARRHGPPRRSPPTCSGWRWARGARRPSGRPDHRARRAWPRPADTS